MLFLLSSLFALHVFAQECVVQSGTNYVDFCENGETCTHWGCRCITPACFHAAIRSPEDCPKRATCGTECCRAGEVCGDAGCICPENNKLCAPPTCEGDCLKSDDKSLMKTTMIHKLQDRLDGMVSGRIDANRGKTITQQALVCNNGMAGPYPCKGIDLMSQISCQDLGGGSNSEGNDIWGWQSGDRDFAIAGLTTGTSFVEITDPENPVVLGFLPVHEGGQASSIWRDMKVYKDYAFIVSEARGSGMQVFNLKRLLSVANPGPSNKFTEDAWYSAQMGTRQTTHNIVINEETGYAYLVGCSTCLGGLLVVDISQPTNPTYAGCFDRDGYTHDAECVIYRGTDHRYLGAEICFAYNENTLTIVDVTDKRNMVQLSRTSYKGVRYSHQGWLSENQEFLVLDDELDEMYNTYDNSKRTVTYVWNVQDLNNPLQIYEFLAPVQAIDHNQYIRGDFSFQSNYASGLRVLSGMNDLGKQNNVQLDSWFDVYPSQDVAEFYGAWSAYPFYEGKNYNIVVVQAIEGGLFVLRVNNFQLSSSFLNQTGSK